MTTVSSTVARKQYNGDGGTTAFSFPYLFFEDDDLVVVLTDADEQDTIQTLTTHYSVSGAGSPSGGTVTMVTAPASGERLTIIRRPAYTQDDDFINTAKLDQETYEDRFTKIVLMVQALSEELGRAPRIKMGSEHTDLTLPYPVSGNVLAWNSAANALENVVNFEGAPLTISAGDGGSLVRVNAAETGLEMWGSIPTISSGDAGKVPKVNSAEDGFDFDDQVPRKDEANVFTQDQRINKVGALLNLGPSDGAASGPHGIQVYSNSLTPAMAFVYRNGAETWNIENNAGTRQVKFHRTGGVVIGSPTGDAQGNGTLNAEAVYDDNSLLTQHVLLAYLNGVVDTDAADADVPDRVRTVQEAEPERWVPETRRVERVVEEHDPARGRVVRKRVQRDEPVVDTVPMVDEAGEPTEEVRRVQRMRRVPAREEVTEVEPRRHEPMHAFAADNPNLEEFDPALFWQRVERDGELPAIRRALEAGRTSTGALLQVLMETAEVQAVHIHQLEQRIKALEEGR